jgi:CubicO group peptidase (beta-lactamase class C family)
MTANHLAAEVKIGTTSLLPPGHGFGLGFAVRHETGMSPSPGAIGEYFWNGVAGTAFFVTPKEDLFAILMIQAQGQREYYRALFRNLVYAAIA